MKLPLPLLISIEKTIAAALRMDPDSRARLLAVDGKVVRVNISSPQLSMIISFIDGQLLLAPPPDSSDTGDENPSADTTITGSLSDLYSLINSNDAVYSGAVKIEGDIGVSQQLRQIIAQLDPDWQDAISPYLGDGLTHRLDMAQSGFTQWFKRTREALRLNTGEYLQEEVELLAPDALINTFCEEVDEVRAALDRLDARIVRLEAQDESCDPAQRDGTDAC